jgi:hypothetical protein
VTSPLEDRDLHQLTGRPSCQLERGLVTLVKKRGLSKDVYVHVQVKQESA